MIKYVEAVIDYVPEDNELTLFFAGGITNCPNWQKELLDLLAPQLKDNNLTIFNPRRENFPIDDPNAAEEQITWEHNFLRKANAISFWFPKETMCPIVLYELGAWSMTKKPLFIGCHPDYERRQDVEIQTQLVRDDIDIVYSIRELGKQIINWVKENQQAI